MGNNSLPLGVTFFVFLALKVVFGQDDDDSGAGYNFPQSRIKSPQLTLLEATCDSSGMQVTVQFDSAFNGIIYSKGSYYTQSCVFVQPNSNKNRYSFSIPVNACGTQNGNDDTKTPPARYVENTVIMQIDAMYQQLTDAARKVRCNWNSNFRSTITFTPFRVDMGSAMQVNFNGNDVTTAMSVQVGRGPFAPVIGEGLVQIGDTLTLVIYLQTKDMSLELQVLDCVAMDGRNRNRIQLTDENGCVLKEKLISTWQTTRETQNTAAEISYAYLTAFKFPDDFTVNIKCNIAVCKGMCPAKPCQGLKYGELPPPPRSGDEIINLQKKTTPEDNGYGVRTFPPTRPTTTMTTTRRTTTTTPEEHAYEILTKPPTTRRTTTTTTTTTTQVPIPPRTPRRVVNSYGIEEVEVPDNYAPVTRPVSRRRTVFDRKRRDIVDQEPQLMAHGQVPLSSSIRVVSPADFSSPNSSILRLSQQPGALDSSTLCVNTVLFAFGVALIFALLVASCITSALLCIRQRTISKKDKDAYDYNNSSPCPDYPKH